MAIQYRDLIPRQPKNMALSFSGGGLRATTFSLGCLSYMETVYFGENKMTDLVRFVSSTSGGTFTGLGWTLALRKGESFQDFYHSFINQVLQGEDLIVKAFGKLKDSKAWKDRPLKSRNLINAFALVYDEEVFKGETFGAYYKANAKILPDMCANLTEFTNGSQFRFQNVAETGNKFLFFTPGNLQPELKAIKLGDILACSSCFTGGFEPVVYPRDFTYGEWTTKKLSDAITYDPRFNPEKSNDDGKPLSFDLMDGGIDDNQGINSFMLAENRLQNKDDNFGHDLYLSCDVSSNFTKGYVFPSDKGKGFLSQFSISFYFLLITILFIATFFPLTYNSIGGAANIIMGITGTLLVIVLGVAIYLISKILKGVKKKNTFALIGKRFGTIFLNLPIHVLRPMLASRISSTGYLATTVFLKKIRRISYDRLFEKITEHKLKADGTIWRKNEDPNLVTQIELKHWSRFCLQNAIYLLSEKNTLQRTEDLKGESWYKNPPHLVFNKETRTLIEWMVPSESLLNTASLAASMETTLWFDKFHQEVKMKESLLATGQFTTCYNLLRYVFRFTTDLLYWKPIQDKLFIDWCKFQEDPFWLVKIYEK